MPCSVSSGPAQDDRVDVRPDAAAVVWDAGLPSGACSFCRPTSSRGRETPPDLSGAVLAIERAVAALGFHNVRLEGHEADDLTHPIRRRRAGWGGDVVIAPTTRTSTRSSARGRRLFHEQDRHGRAKDGVLLGPAEVEAKWGVPPGLIPDVLALTGDAVDNIPGVEGVGTKTATKLVREHGRVALLAENPSVIPNEKLRAKVAAAADRLRDNLELVRLEQDLPLPVALEALSLRPDPAAMLAVARECEFRSLTAEFEKLAGAKDKPVQGEVF